MKTMVELCQKKCVGCQHDGTLCRQFVHLLDKWIPVSERLPEKDMEVLVSMEMKMVGEQTYIDIAYFSRDLYAGFYKRSSEWGAYEVNPIAWHPLPERRE